MKTLKRLILLEATFQRVEDYTGKLDSKSIIINGCTWLINQLKEAE